MKNCFEIKKMSLSYGEFLVIKDINMDIKKGKVTAFIGPSGCGKSTFIKSLNRMNDLVENCKIKGKILFDGKNIYKDYDVNVLRKKVGMVFQKPNPFPMSIYDNITFGPKTHGVKKKSKLDEIVESSLRDVALWDDLKDRLDESALGLSGGQQQRLCIARTLAVNPEVILMDEPTSALDPISTLKIEELILRLKKEYTIVIVTHNMQQAARISDQTTFFYLARSLNLTIQTKFLIIQKTKKHKIMLMGDLVKIYFIVFTREFFLVFVLEDDPNILEFVLYALKSQNIESQGFLDTETFKKALKTTLPQALVLDVMLPDVSGFEILKDIKANSATQDIPVLMLTALNSELDKVKGLDFGADDYITKPFSIMEFLARVRAVLRRNKESDMICYGELEFSYATRNVKICKKSIALTLKEFELLGFLLKNQNRAFSRDELLEILWGYSYSGESRTIDIHIKTLRKKLGVAGKYIKTIRGVGYKISKDS